MNRWEEKKNGTKSWFLKPHHTVSKEGFRSNLDNSSTLNFWRFARVSGESFCERCYAFIVVQLLNPVQLCDPIDCNTPCFPVLHYLWSLLKFIHALSQ